jgi:hypothetical protein
MSENPWIRNISEYECMKSFMHHYRCMNEYKACLSMHALSHGTTTGAWMYSRHPSIRMYEVMHSPLQVHEWIRGTPQYACMMSCIHHYRCTNEFKTGLNMHVWSHTFTTTGARMNSRQASICTYEVMHSPLQVHEWIRGTPQYTRMKSCMHHYRCMNEFEAPLNTHAWSHAFTTTAAWMNSRHPSIRMHEVTDAALQVDEWIRGIPEYAWDRSVFEGAYLVTQCPWASHVKLLIIWRRKCCDILYFSFIWTDGELWNCMTSAGAVCTYGELPPDSWVSRARTRTQSWFRTWGTGSLHAQSSNPVHSRWRVKPTEWRTIRGS